MAGWKPLASAGLYWGPVWGAGYGTGMTGADSRPGLVAGGGGELSRVRGAHGDGGPGCGDGVSHGGHGVHVVEVGRVGVGVRGVGEVRRVVSGGVVERCGGVVGRGGVGRHGGVRAGVGQRMRG